MWVPGSGACDPHAHAFVTKSMETKGGWRYLGGSAHGWGRLSLPRTPARVEGCGPGMSWLCAVQLHVWAMAGVGPCWPGRHHHARACLLSNLWALSAPVALATR